MQHQVYNNQGLNAALQSASSGDTIVLHKSSNPYEISISNYVNDVHNITFTSADANNPAEIIDVRMYDTSNIEFNNLMFIGDLNTPAYDVTIDIRRSEDITIRDSEVKGPATGALIPGNGVRDAGQFGTIKDVDGFTFENNEMHLFNYGLMVLETTDVRITNNDVHSMQGDPIQMGGVKDVFIEGNYLHHPLGSDTSVNHMDMIQMWSTGTKIVSENIYIRENIIEAGEGTGTQSIFIRNDRYEATKSDALLYKNIVVSDNVIYNGHYHGITATDVNGLSIYNNTLVTNPEAYVLRIYDENQLSDPAISTSASSKNVKVYNNMAGRIDLPNSAQQGNNTIINYDNPLAPEYVDNLFVNGLADEMNILIDLQALPGGLADTRSLGSKLLEFDETPTEIFALLDDQPGSGLGLNTHSFDVGRIYDQNGAVNTDGAIVAWDFGDGHNHADDTTSAHFYEKPGVYSVKANITLADGRKLVAEKTIAAESPVVLALDFDNGTTDISPAPIIPGHTSGNVQFVWDRGSEVAKLNGGHIRYEATEDFRNNAGFSVVADFRKDNLSDHGEVMRFPGSFTVAVRDNALQATLTTEKGEFTIHERWLPMDDTDWHRVVLSFDGPDQSAALYLDGKLVGSASGVGTMQKGIVGTDLYIGSPYNTSFGGLIDNVSFLRGGMSAEEAAGLGAPHSGTDTLTYKYISGLPSDPVLDEDVLAAEVETPAPAPTPAPTPDPAPAPIASSEKGSVSGRYFVDENENNREDGGEAGVAGATVQVMRGGVVVKSAVTDANGNYSVSGLEDGYYTVRFSADNVARDFVRANSGSEATDSDVWKTDGSGNGLTSGVRVTQSGVSNVDAGVEDTGETAPVASPPLNIVEPIVPSSGGSAIITGRYFVDENGNNREDSGEAGVAGATVRVYDGATLVGSVLTDANGKYTVSGLANNYYTLSFEADRAGRDFVGANAGDDYNDSDVWRSDSAGNGLTSGIYASNKKPATNVDAGVEGTSSGSTASTAAATQGSTIAGRYFVDRNGDNRDSAGDGVVSGATVALMSAGRVVATTLTNSNGEYSFNGLSDGYYIVRFDKDSGQSFVRANSGHNDSNDSDVWKTDGSGDGLTNAFLVNGSRNEMNADAGIMVQASQTLSATAFEEPDASAVAQVSSVSISTETMGKDDVTIIDGQITRDDLTYDAQQGILRIDTDNDGGSDEIIALGSDVSGGDFMTIYNGTQTMIVFSNFIAPLSNGVALAADQINGVEHDLYLRGSDAVSEFAITVLEENGAHSIGVYEYAEDGTLSNIRVLEANTTADGTTHEVSVTNGNGLGFFLIQDGYDRLDNNVFDEGVLGLATDGGTVRLTVSDRVIDDALVFVSHHAWLNVDHKQHMVSGLDASGEGLVIGFEDARRDAGSDEDFQDVVLHVEQLLEIA